MAKQRYVDTKFWDDSYIIKLDPIEKLVFLYLLTNPLTNIAGIYEVALKRVAFDTGIDQDTILNIFKRFSRDKKAYFLDGWIILPNFPKHQNYQESPKIKQGIESIIKEIPMFLLKKIDTLSIPYLYPLNYTNIIKLNNNADSLKRTATTNMKINKSRFKGYNEVEAFEEAKITPEGEPIDSSMTKFLKENKKFMADYENLEAAYLTGYVKSIADKDQVTKFNRPMMIKKFREQLLGYSLEEMIKYLSDFFADDWYKKTNWSFRSFLSEGTLNKFKND